MKLGRVTRFMLRFSYSYIRLMGLLHFSYNFATGRVSYPRRNVIFAALSNLFLMAQLPLVRIDNLKLLLKTQVNDLHMFVYLSLSGMRIVVVLITVALNWWRGKELFALVRDFQSVRQAHFGRFKTDFEQQRRFEKGIWYKFFAIVCGDFSLMMTLVDMMRHIMNFRLCLSLIVVASLSNMMNAILSVYYLAIMLIILHFHMLNEELQRILCQANAASVFKLRRPGVFITLCCQLADDLDVLAVAHLKLQRIAQRVNALFEIYLTLFMANIFFNMIGSCYQVYAGLKHHVAANLSDVGSIFSLITLAAYYIDVSLLSETIMDMLQAANAAASLLQRKWPTSLLDVRLERSLENFALQLSRDPLELWLLGLYKYENQILFAAFSTSVSHILVLIQYDYKNY